MAKTIILTITNKCNLNCTYCYEDFKNNRNMSLDVAKEILLEGFKENEGGEFEVDFHGGEPMCNFELIRDLCEWAFSEKRECKYRFFIATNGTILTPEMKEWFTKHKDRVNLGLSADGDREMHNINRSNSFDKIDFDFFLENWPKQQVKMTISEQTIHNIARGVIFLHGKGFDVAYNLALGIDWEPELLEVYKAQIDQIVEYYIQNPSINRAMNLSKRISAVLSNNKVVRDCGAGKQMRSYDTEGKAYPCHMFTDNTLDQDIWETIAKTDFSDDALYGDPECEACPIYRICPTCYGMNFKERGNIGSRDKRLCGYNKIEALAMCKLKYNDLINKDTADFTQDDYKDLKAVKYLTDNL
ncbi:MAG: radical SAM protein [Rikenellaceae bacterium]